MTNMNSINGRWAAADKGRVADMICPRLDRWCTVRLLELHRGVFNVFIGVATGHCITDVLARRIGVGLSANDFCRSCGNEKREDNVLYLPTLCKREKRHLCAY